MMTKLFILTVVFFATDCITVSSAQFWRKPDGFVYPKHPQRYYPNYYESKQYQNNGFQNNMQLPPGISMSEAEWICKNSKTGDMMIIASEEGFISNLEINHHNDQPPNTSVTQPPLSTPVPNLKPKDTSDTTGEDIIDIRLGNK